MSHSYHRFSGQAGQDRFVPSNQGNVVKTVLSLCLALVAGLVPLPAKELQVFAAASLTDALKDIAPGYETSGGAKLRFNFAGSNALARQIQEGAPADVFLSADEAQMDALEKAGLLLDANRRVLLSNTLVVVVEKGRTLALGAAGALRGPAVKRLALADPRGVPAGIYAREYLEKAGMWDDVKDRVIPTENVRAALAAVESGDADAGIVYGTDTTLSPEVRVAYEIPADEGPYISYPMAVIKTSPHSDEAKNFLAYLRSEPALAVWKKHGFVVRL